MNRKAWNPDKDLAAPLRYRKRCAVRVVVDLFEEGRPFERIAAEYGVMAAAEGQTFEVWTETPERAARFFRWFASRADPYDGWGHVPSMVNGDMVMDRWMRLAHDPLSNVRLGAPARTQPEANRNIPALLRCPAAMRVAVCSPMGGAVNLSPWLKPKTWHDYAFMVAGETRYGGAASYFGHPRAPEHDKPAHGRLDAVICGGGNDPLHPDWVRALRDQCVEAGAGFTFEGWGQWAPGAAPMGGQDIVILPSGEIVGGGDGRTGYLMEVPDDAGAVWLRRVGKARAGRRLDGRTWDECPGGVR